MLRLSGKIDFSDLAYIFKNTHIPRIDFINFDNAFDFLI